MKKKNLFNYLLLVILLVITMGCKSIDSDAKKAAALIEKSSLQMTELKFEKAEENYLKAQEIIQKYQEKDKSVEFFELMATYRDKEKEEKTK